MLPTVPRSESPDAAQCRCCCCSMLLQAGAYSWGYAILSGFLVVAVAIMYGSLLVYRVAKG